MLLEAVCFSNSAGSAKVKPFVFPLNREESVRSLLWFRQIERMSGPQCCSNPPTLNPSSGSGHVEKLAGLDSYLTGSPDSKLAVLLIADIFGTFPSLQKSTFVSFWFGILLILFIIWSGLFSFCNFDWFSVFGLMGTDFQVVYVDGCLCICLIDLFHGISFWHFRFCFAMQDMKLPS